MPLQQLFIRKSGSFGDDPGNFLLRLFHAKGGAGAEKQRNLIRFLYNQMFPNDAHSATH